jgi:protein TonB
LDSAANSTSKAAKPPTSPRKASGGTPIAHETQVIATGTHQAENSDKRELFKEATSTALVFPNGGVIRLSAAVDPGQLLFLTNQETRREVVAQVTRKRVNPSSGFYIELEFTEPAPDFWGIEFPENPVAAPANEPQSSAGDYELMHSDEAAPDDLSPNAPAPTTAEVQALVDEVEALRARLRSMQTQTPPAQPELASLDAPIPSSAPAPPLPAMLAAILDQSIAEQKSKAPSGHADPSAPENTSTLSAETPQSEDQQAVAASKSEPEEDLLPKPALDFQKSKSPKQIPPPVEYGPPSSDRMGLLRLALLAVVSLFAVSVAAWNMHWLPWLNGPANPSGSASAPSRSTANSSTAAHQAAPKSDQHLDANASTPPSAANSTAAPQGTASTEGPSPDAQEEPAQSTDAASEPITKKDSPVVSVARRTPVHSAPVPEDAPADDTTAIVPPRLVKSVKPTAPSDALQSFVTGNVTLDALVDKSGRVESMKVLSGPPSFHKAAMEALKQYRYEPARQHGKPVSAHVTVTVPFLFEP